MFSFTDQSRRSWRYVNFVGILNLELCTSGLKQGKSLDKSAFDPAWRYLVLTLYTYMCVYVYIYIYMYM